MEENRIEVLVIAGNHLLEVVLQAVVQLEHLLLV